MDYSVIYNTSSTDAWSQVFHICLEHCDSFRIFYPDGEYDQENPLLAGKDQFEKLPNNKILPWDGMKDSISIEGKLTEDAKALFLTFTEPSYPELWSYQLLHNAIDFFEVQDFTVSRL